MGELITDSVEFTRKLKDSVQKAMPLLEAMRKLVEYEGNVGDEFVTLMHTRLSVSDEEDATIKKILECIAAPLTDRRDIKTSFRETQRTQ